VIRSATVISFFRKFIPYVESKFRRPARDERVGPSPVFPWEATEPLRFAFAHPEMFFRPSVPQSAALITQTPQELSAAGTFRHTIDPIDGAPLFGEPINLPHWQHNSVFRSGPEKTNRVLKNLAILL